MATPVIYQGDDTDFNGAAALSVNLATDFDLDGCSVSMWFQGCRRDFTGLSGRTAVLSIAFSSQETASMPVGTHRAIVKVYDSAGRVRTASDSVRIRVTDDLREAYGGADAQEIDVSVEMGIDPSKLMDGETLRTNTPNSLRQTVKKIAQALGATVSVLAVSVLGATVQTAPFGELDLDKNPRVVTNVTFEGLLTEHQDISGKADASNTYTKAETDARIVELSPPTSLEPSTNYTDAVAAGLAPTNHSHAALTDGTNTIAATREVYEWRQTGYTDWVPTIQEVVQGEYVYKAVDYALPKYFDTAEELGNDSYYSTYSFWQGSGWYYMFDVYQNGEQITTAGDYRSGPSNALELASSYFGYVRGYTYEPIHKGRLALTNDIPAAVREYSLGGIWDTELEVWWTPRMRGGSLTYEATTNVNLNAEN